MSEKILKALMRLFAIIAQSEEDSQHARAVVETFLKQQLNKEQVLEYLAIYDDFLRQQNDGAEGEKKKRRLAVSSVKVIVICNQINEALSQKQKVVLLLNLIEFVSSNKMISEQEMEFVSTVSSCFNIPDSELAQCLQLSKCATVYDLEDAPDWLVISQTHPQHAHIKFIYSESIVGEIAVLQIKSVSMYLLRYYGKSELLLNGQAILPASIYILSPGSSIRSHKVLPIYYSDIVSCFLSDSIRNNLSFEARNIEFNFRNGKQGLHQLSFKETTGKLIGIMGGSGAGKSTLLNILNGNNFPTQGEVVVNGFNLHREKKMLEGVIGYVPQDDLLIEEITVFQNLFYNSKLCFAHLSDQEIEKMVDSKLLDLGLLESKNLKVGNSLDKTISGGQRKRLNIALELIREPSVLFVDEPTSGLSSRDSENIMDLLKELALKGKLVLVVIHQPSSDIFKMFDKLLILDAGGYPIYYGNPVESLIYFKTKVNHINANDGECVYCGNVNPEQVFNIIEAKVLDENGNQTRERRISPQEWNEQYRKEIEWPLLPERDSKKLQNQASFQKPNFIQQFQVFWTRNILSKVSNTQYLLINLLEAPVLALLLASLIKYYKSNGTYVFYESKNLPAYLFMCVLVALFIGLTVSAEEIIRDRKILKRESFLNLSKGSYLLSKILFLFLLSAIQTFLFVIIGNTILEIQGMYVDYWLVLFSASCFANLLGLNISAAFNSAVTIYILIPFLLIPQILLSGVIVKFEELNPRIASQSVVPVWGEMMASRWAFEALAVNQFAGNKYEKEIFEQEKEISNATFKKVYWTSKMNSVLDEIEKLKGLKSVKAEERINLVKNELLKEEQAYPKIFEEVGLKLENENWDSKKLREILSRLKEKYASNYERAQQKKDDWINKFQISESGKAVYQDLLLSNQNKKLEEAVKNANPDLEPVVEEGGNLVATADPIFRDGPRNRWIRAQFYAPQKSLFGKYYSTFWVNIFVLWMMTGSLVLTLYFDFFKRVLRGFSGLKR